MRALVILLCVIGVGVSLMALAFYTTMHPTGLCPPSNPYCGAQMKSDQAGVHISE